jgi:sugar/nucleoside kinase (ribokinase family)
VPRVAVVGNLARDVVDGGAPSPGGCPFFAAEAFRRLGEEGQIVTRFAERDRTLFAPALAGLGTPVTLLPATSTSGFSLDYEGEERVMGVTGIGQTWEPDDAAALDPGVSWVHVAPLLRSDFPAATLAALADGRRLSLDGQGLVRKPAVGPLVLDADFDPAILRHVTILKLSEDEASVLVDGLDERALRELGVPEVIVTLGSKGAIVYSDGLAEHIPASSSRPTRDPTGAGDGFAAAYLAARSSGHAPSAAARRASSVVAALLSEGKKRR